MPDEVGYPRIERNADDVPIVNIGPHGGLAVAAAFMYWYLPSKWPADWPKDGVISIYDPRVGGGRVSGKMEVPMEEDRVLLYYEEREVDAD